MRIQSLAPPAGGQCMKRAVAQRSADFPVFDVLQGRLYLSPARIVPVGDQLLCGDIQRFGPDAQGEADSGFVEYQPVAGLVHQSPAFAVPADFGPVAMLVRSVVEEDADGAFTLRQHPERIPGARIDRCVFRRIAQAVFVLAGLPALAQAGALETRIEPQVAEAANGRLVRYADVSHRHAEAPREDEKQHRRAHGSLIASHGRVAH